MLQRPDIRYAQVIKNSGEAAGASIRHTHSQIFGLPFVPQGILEELNGARTFFNQHGNCVYCQTLDQELGVFNSGDTQHRIVGQSENFVAWCPYASRVAYEVHVAPRGHSARFEKTSRERINELAKLLRSIVHNLDQHPRIDAFNYLIHTLPAEHADTDAYHWHIEIIPRIAKEAGFEWATGVHINTVAPEQAAVELSLIGSKSNS
jgi:UDPglucose--hexose-1-phosphate uridylyltransferase